MTGVPSGATSAGPARLHGLDALRGIRAAMALLALPRKTLYDKLTRHGIDPNEFRLRPQSTKGK
jgi:hypothetical protein